MHSYHSVEIHLIPPVQKAYHFGDGQDCPVRPRYSWTFFCPLHRNAIGVMRNLLPVAMQPGIIQLRERPLETFLQLVKLNLNPAPLQVGYFVVELRSEW